MVVRIDGVGAVVDAVAASSREPGDGVADDRDVLVDHVVEGDLERELAVDAEEIRAARRRHVVDELRHRGSVRASLTPPGSIICVPAGRSPLSIAACAPTNPMSMTAILIPTPVTPDPCSPSTPLAEISWPVTSAGTCRSGVPTETTPALEDSSSARRRGRAPGRDSRGAPRPVLRAAWPRQRRRTRGRPSPGGS